MTTHTMETSANSPCCLAFMFSFWYLFKEATWKNTRGDRSNLYYHYLTDDDFVPSFSSFITRPSNILITLLHDAANATRHQIDNLCYFPDDLLCSVWDTIWKKSWCNKKYRSILLNQLDSEGYMWSNERISENF
jgi:hypothetical protein